MQLHGHKHHVAVTGRFCGLPPDHTTLLAIESALLRADRALSGGRLLSSGEAMAIAGPEARTKETLFSIARAVAWEMHADQDRVLGALEEHFPDLA